MAGIGSQTQLFEFQIAPFFAGYPLLGPSRRDMDRLHRAA